MNGHLEEFSELLDTVHSQGMGSIAPGGACGCLWSCFTSHLSGLHQFIQQGLARPCFISSSGVTNWWSQLGWEVNIFKESRCDRFSALNTKMTESQAYAVNSEFWVKTAFNRVSCSRWRRGCWVMSAAPDYFLPSLLAAERQSQHGRWRGGGETSTFLFTVFHFKTQHSFSVFQSKPKWKCAVSIHVFSSTARENTNSTWANRKLLFLRVRKLWLDDLNGYAL